jgi:chromosomal replication initiation ATPase DnaA
METKEGLKALSSAVNEMAEQEKKREVSSTQAKQLESIEKALNKPSDSYKIIYQNYMDKKVEGTGEWLLQNSEFSAWAKQEPGTSSVLCLAGGEGYGKSFLMSMAVQDLRRRFPPGDNVTTRTSIAYYYFQRESKSSKSEKDVLSLSNALKSLALQIAKLDIVYRKELHASCEAIEDLQVTELWNKLFEPAYKHDAAFYRE